MEKRQRTKWKRELVIRREGGWGGKGALKVRVLMNWYDEKRGNLSDIRLGEKGWRETYLQGGNVETDQQAFQHVSTGWDVSQCAHSASLLFRVVLSWLYLMPSPLLCLIKGLACFLGE